MMQSQEQPQQPQTAQYDQYGAMENGAYAAPPAPAPRAPAKKDGNGNKMMAILGTAALVVLGAVALFLLMWLTGCIGKKSAQRPREDLLNSGWHKEQRREIDDFRKQIGGGNISGGGLGTHDPFGGNNFGRGAGIGNSYSQNGIRQVENFFMRI